MKVAIISDTHDNLPNVRSLVKKLKNEKVDLILHAGDIVAPFTLKEFRGFKLYFVFGNNDGERKLLRETSRKLGFIALEDFGSLEIDGKKFALIHGKDEEVVVALCKSGLYDVVVRGHTHKHEVKRVNGTLLINPGEVCGYLFGEATYVIYDTKEDRAQLLTL